MKTENTEDIGLNSMRLLQPLYQVTLLMQKKRN